MPPLNPIDTWSERSYASIKLPKAKWFIVVEGSNTEYWYFEELAHMLSRRNLPRLIELVPVKRDGAEQDQSSPRKLAEHVRAVRKDEDGRFGFDAKSDRVVMVFDVDIYKGRMQEYQSDLDAFQKDAIVAVTYPSFELFLLLHKEGAVKELILPNKESIQANSYAPNSRRRFVEKLASDALGFNAKKNAAGVRGVVQNYRIAVEAEKGLNQNPENAVEQITSNVGAVIDEALRTGE